MTTNLTSSEQSCYVKLAPSMRLAERKVLDRLVESLTQRIAEEKAKSIRLGRMARQNFGE